MLERLAAEKRQQAKVSEKKAKAEAQRQAAEAAARNHTKAVQTKRSTVFAQARKGNGAAVKDGVWEDSVDPAGGEVKYAQFVQTPPKDPQETLLHIAAKHGDADLVQWLDAHSMSNPHDALAVVSLIVISRRRPRRTKLRWSDCFPSRPSPRSHHDRLSLP